VERYGWNQGKERINVWKHGITFDEAESVVDNPSSRTRYDVVHSMDEPRFITVGWSSMGRLLVVITSDGGPHPRIISAWRATKRERDAYVRR
jgi:uncharacterized DUF497 family protein